MKLTFEYDANGYRATKKVYSRSDGEWVLVKTVKFVYAGPLLIAELDGDDALIRSYTWGRDLSGGLTAAGGVGGLLAVKNHATGKTYWPVCDDKGNVTALVDADAENHPVVASMEYGPYGELIAVDGSTGSGIDRTTIAEVCPLLWSTKYLDAELAPSGGLYYYGYRYYDPTSGKWLSRDPLAERGGLNLYAFKDPLNYVDPEGLLYQQLARKGDTVFIHYYESEDSGYIGAVEFSLTALKAARDNPNAMVSRSLSHWWRVCRSATTEAEARSLIAGRVPASLSRGDAGSEFWAGARGFVGGGVGAGTGMAVGVAKFGYKSTLGGLVDIGQGVSYRLGFCEAEDITPQSYAGQLTMASSSKGEVFGTMAVEDLKAPVKVPYEFGKRMVGEDAPKYFRGESFDTSWERNIEKGEAAGAMGLYVAGLKDASQIKAKVYTASPKGHATGVGRVRR